MSSTNETPGQHLRRARAAAGFTQQQLADLVGVHRVAITTWETDRRRPHRRNARRLQQALGQPVSTCGHYPHYQDGLCRACHESQDSCVHVREGDAAHHAGGKCKACYDASRQRWPKWLDRCLECGSPKADVSYRSWGRCRSCDNYSTMLTRDVRMRYYLARWCGDTLRAALETVTRLHGAELVAERLGVPKQHLLKALRRRNRPVSVQWAAAVWELSKELAAA